MPAAPPSAGRLLFLDGLRALASLYVVLHHCCQIYQDPQALPRYGYYPVIPWLLHGRAVAVFMVLSGFLLMMPVTRSASGRMPDGFWCYMKRRVRRIVPPYYASMAVALLCIALVPGMNRGTGDFWSRAVPAFSAGNILSHLLLLHGLRPNWVYQINPPLWTLATEWMLYFLFPLLLLPLWRKFGTFKMVLIATAIGFLPRAALHNTAWHFNWIAPWFLGLFAVGMAGAVLQTAKVEQKFKTHFVGAPGVAVLAVGFLTLWHSRVAMDYLFGLSTLWLILYCGQDGEPSSQSVRRGLLRLLQSRFLGLVSGFSYSIYLVHGPMLMMAYRAIEPFHVSAGLRAAYMFLFAPAVAIAAAWLFYRWVERPLQPLAVVKTPLAVAAPPPAPARTWRMRPIKWRQTKSEAASAYKTR